MFDFLGYRHFPTALSASIGHLINLLRPHDLGRAGERLTTGGPLSSWLTSSEQIRRVLADLGMPHAKAVRAVLFDKSPAANWALGWHQDRTICVKEYRDTPGYGPFSNKAGLIHVEPPFDLLERMITLRIHLDPVVETNAPLMLAEGSHLLGRVPAKQAEQVVAKLNTVQCLAGTGDIWGYATPILHASARSQIVSRRRVLQIDFSSEDLPGGLEWLGV